MEIILEKCEVNTNNIKKLDDRITKLEQYREKDKEQIFELDKSLSGFITEMKHISNDLKNVILNLKELISRNTVSQEKEIAELKEQVINQGKQIKTLEEKLTNETIAKDAEKWNNISKYILTTILGLVIGYIFFHIGIKK